MNKILFALLTICLLAGCSTQPGSTEPASTPQVTAPITNETSKNITIKDYSVAGMVNVTNVRFACKQQLSWGGYLVEEAEPNLATHILVNVMCPRCNKETSVTLEFAEFPNASIGQAAFTYTGVIDCSNWYNHDDSFDSKYNYSIIFTLNQQ